MADDPKTKKKPASAPDAESGSLAAAPKPNAAAELTDEEYNAQAQAALKVESSGGTAQPEPESPVKSWWQRFNAVMSKQRDPKEVARGAVRGVAGALVEMERTGVELATGIATHDFGLAKKAGEVVGKAGHAAQDAVLGKRSDDGLADFTESTLQFVTGFAATNAVIPGSSVLAGLAKGALTDFSVFDPYEAQLAELASRTHIPGVKQLGDLLSVKGDDGLLVARFKRAAAGAIPGMALDGLVAGARKLGAIAVLKKGATGAEKKAAEATLAESQKTLQAIADGTHVPEDSHVKVVPTEEGFTLESHSDPSIEHAGTDNALEGVTGSNTLTFADEAEAVQQAATADHVIQDQLNAGKVDLDHEAITEAIKEGVPDEAPLVSSAHNTVDQDMELVKALSESIIEKRSAIEATTGGSITIEQAKQLAKDTLGQIPEDQLHGTMMALLKENPESQDIVSLAADMVLGQKGRDILKLHDIVDARPHDPIAMEQYIRAMNNYFAMRHELRPGESAAARRLRFVQERGAMRAETFETAEQVAAKSEASKHVADVQDAVAKVKEAINRTDTDAVSAADFSLARARKKLEAAYETIQNGSKKFKHDPEAAKARAGEIKGLADEQRATPDELKTLSPEEQAQLKATKTSTVNPIEKLSQLLDSAEVHLDKAVEKAKLPKREKAPRQTTPIDDAFAEVKRQAKEDPQARKLPDEPKPALEVEKSQDLTLDEIDTSLKDLLDGLNGDREVSANALEGVKGKRTKRIGLSAAQDEGQLRDIAGMKQRDASQIVVNEANAKLYGRMFKLSNGSPRDVDAIVRASVAVQKGGTPRKIIELFTNFLLSGPPTWATVITSGQALSLFEPAVKMTAGAIGGNTAMIREGVDTLFGLYSHLGDNIKVAAAAIREGRSIINPAPTTYAIGGLTGKIIRSPGNIMMGLDEFTRVSNYRAYVRAKSLRAGREAGLEGAALAKKVADDLQAAFDPNTGIATIPQALKYADVPTLSAGLTDGSFGRALQNFTNDAFMAKMVVPFVRASANIFDYVWQSAPLLNQFNSTAREALKAGGEEAARLHARSLLATTVGMWAYLQAKQGNLTGKGPSDPDLRKAWLRDNQPYSIRVGDHWVSYNRMDPAASWLGIIADLHVFGEELGHEHMDVEKMTYAITGALAANMASKTYLRGIFDFSEAWNKGDANAVGKYLRRQVSSLAVPTLVDKLNPDPYYREVESMADAIKAKLPYFSKDLDARYNFLGEKEMKAPGLMNRAANPFTIREVKQSAVEQELLTIGKGFAPAPEKIGEGMIDLHDKSYAEKPGQSSPYTRMMELIRNPGNGLPSLREAMMERIKDPAWNEMSDGTDDFKGGRKWLVLAGLKQRYEQQALRQVRQEYPKLDEQLRAVLRARGAAIRGGEAGQAASELLTGPIRR